MGTIVTCDCDDCYNMDTNYDGNIYYVLDENLKEKLGFTYEDNICQRCVDMYNSENEEDMIIVDPNDDDYVILNPRCKERCGA